MVRDFIVKHLNFRPCGQVLGAAGTRVAIPLPTGGWRRNRLRRLLGEWFNCIRLVAGLVCRSPAGLFTLVDSTGIGPPYGVGRVRSVSVAEFAEAGPLFEAAGCEGSLLVVDVSDGHGLAWRPNTVHVAASVFKLLVALELTCRAAGGEIDLSRRLHLTPDRFTLGETGLSRSREPVDISLWDLAQSMMTVSDNAATDALIDVLGLARINQTAQDLGLRDTVVVEDLARTLRRFASDLDFGSYRELLDAQSGRLGVVAQEAATSHRRIARSSVLDPSAATRTSARDMVRLLRMVWAEDGLPPEGCSNLRDLMAAQPSTRIGGALPTGWRVVGAKTGSLFGVALHEVGVMRSSAGRLFAVAVLTRAYEPYQGQPAILRAISDVVALAVSGLACE